MKKMLVSIGVLFFIGCVSNASFSQQTKPRMKEYPAKVVDVYDGDSITLIIDLGLGIRKEEKVRLNGVDTDELNDKDPIKREHALKAREFVNPESAFGVSEQAI